MGYIVCATHGTNTCEKTHYDTLEEAQDAVITILTGDISRILANDEDLDEHDAEELAASYTTIVKDGK